MRPHAIIVLAVAAALGASGRIAHATETGVAAGMFAGGSALPQVRSDARIEVHGGYADVVVTQTFRNDLDRGVEAVYVFPLPGDAAVRSMEIATGDETITSQIAKRDDARKAYEAAVAAGATAAMTEEERADVFTQEVTGIAAKAEVTVTLRFDMAIRRTATGWELVLPLVVAPRHVAGTATGAPTHGTGTAPDTDKVGDASRVTPPVRSEGGNPISVTIDLGDVDKAGVDVPTHEAEVAAHRGHTTVTVNDGRSDRDLVVRWAGAASKGGARALGEKSGDGDGGVVAVTIEAPRGEGHAAHRRWLLAIDASGSMDGDALLLLRDAAHALIEKVGDDPIAVLDPDSGAATWKHGARGREEARAQVDDLQVGGGGELGDLITHAIAAANAAGDGDEVEVVLISDALVADDDAVAASVDGKVRVHVIGVGSAPNRWLLDALARRGRGGEIVLGAGDDVDASVADLVATAQLAAVTPTVDWGALAVHDVTPSTMPALAAGRAVTVSARVDRLVDAKIVVRFGNSKRVAKLDAGAGDDDGLLSRRWARSRVEELAVDASSNADAIAQLGLDHGLVTPDTALIAVGRRVAVDGGVQTTVTVPVAMPAGMRWQSVFGAGGDAAVKVTETNDIGDQTLAHERDHDGAGSGSGAPSGGDDTGGAGGTKKAPEHRNEDASKDKGKGVHEHNPPVAVQPQPVSPPPPVVATNGTTTTAAGGEAGTGQTPPTTTTATAEPEAPREEADEDFGEVITVAGESESVTHRKWSGSLSFTGGIHVRDAGTGLALQLDAGGYHAVVGRLALGLQLQLRDAPTVTGGLDVAAFAGARIWFGPPLVPFRLDLGLGAALDEPGFAWRAALRVGRWRFAPVLDADQSFHDGTRTTVGAGVDWRF